MNSIRNIMLPLVIMMFLTACDSGNESATVASANNLSNKLDKILHDDGILKFNSKNLDNGDKLSISLPVPHPKELAIKSPDGNWFYLHVENEGASEMLMPKEQFAVLTKLDFDTSKLEARFWDDGKAKRGKVFTKTGKYLIYMADNLETEVDNTLFFSSVIQYTDTNK